MEATIKKTFPVTGLSCASCAMSVESMLKSQNGVVDATVNFANSSAYVEYKPGLANVNNFKTAIQSIGYDLLIEEAAQSKQEEIQQSHYMGFGASLTCSCYGYVFYGHALCQLDYAFPHNTSYPLVWPRLFH